MSRRAAASSGTSRAATFATWGQGNVEVTALGVYDNSYCTRTGLAADGAIVHCFAANGAHVDVPFTILIG